ncbi:hypothetical protein [Polaromonas sp.]|uniref:hypothetical protein n=1 Tax=Polaromonas sp. TaxID=1869339 RepID=UPI001A1D64F6|nr:hypothetical protein [Burkholderiales bacterium]
MKLATYKDASRDGQLVVVSRDLSTAHYATGIANTRPVSTGSIVGAGPASNADWSQGYSCIAEKRALETADNGKASTRFMKCGDTLRIEVKGKNGQSVFGAIEQEITPLA